MCRGCEFLTSVLPDEFSSFPNALDGVCVWGRGVVMLPGEVGDGVSLADLRFWGPLLSPLSKEPSPKPQFY